MSAGTDVGRARGEVRTAASLAGPVMAVIIVLWGLGPNVMKMVSAPPLVGVSVRFWLAVPVVWIVTYATGRRMTAEALRRTALAGALFGINLAFVFAALQHVSIAVLSVLQALQPGLVLLVAGRWLGERATGWHVAWTGVGVLGAAIVVLGGEPEVSGDTFGIVLGSVAMITFTGYYLINARVRSTTNMDPLQWMAGVTLFAAITITPVALLSASPGDYGQLGTADLAYLAFVALVVGLISHTMMSWAHRFIPASRSSLYLLAMNIVAVGAAWPLHDEPVTLVQVLGGLVVLGAVAAVVSRPAPPRARAAADDQPLTASVD